MNIVQYGKMLLLTMAAIGSLWATPAAAQVGDYPNRPVTLIVSYAAGGSSDFFTRLMATELSKLWGRAVVVENKPGAGGTLGAAIAAKSPADGYTLFMGSIATHAISASLYKDLGYDPIKDFAPISKIATVPNILVVNNEVPVNNLKEFLTWARADKKNAFYASAGLGTSPQLSAELLKVQAKIDLTNVSYKGDAPALADVVAGQVPMAIVNLPSAVGLVRGGKVKALAVTSTQRSHEFPEVPTMQEAGVPEYNVTSWWAMFAPAGTPAALTNKLNADVVKVLRSKSAIDGIQKSGGAAAPSSQAELAGLVSSETKRWGDLIRSSGIAAN